MQIEKVNNQPVKRPTVESVTITLSRQDLKYLYALSFRHEGGPGFPEYGRLHQHIAALDPSIAEQFNRTMTHAGFGEVVR